MSKAEAAGPFLLKKPVKSLLLLKRAKEPMYATVIAKNIDTTYAHTLRILSKLEKLGLIRFEKAGRIKLVRLTRVGEKSAEVLEFFGQVVKLAAIEKKLEQFYQNKIKGRLPSEMDYTKITRRLKGVRRELERLVEEAPKLREHVQEVLARIKRILAEAKRTKK
jgi:predicted transcriptional regulator